MKKTIITLSFCTFLLSLCLVLPAHAAKLTGEYEDKIFFNVNNIVYVTDQNGQNAKVIFKTKTSGPNDITEPDSLQLIKNNIFGYSFAKSCMDDCDDYIYSYDLDNRKTKLLKKIGEGYFKQLTFYDKNTYSYVLNRMAGYWDLYLVSNNKTKKLVTWQGRDWSETHSAESGDSLNFSPNGQKIMHFAPSSPRSKNGKDFKVYIYDRAGHLKNKVGQATQPEWISDTEIVYRKYKKGYLYSYDLQTKKSTKLEGTPRDSHDPKHLPDSQKITFWAGNAEKSRVYTYDLQSSELTNVGDDLTSPIWVSENKLSVYQTDSCDYAHNTCAAPTKGRSGILNLEDNSLTLIPKIFNEWSWYYPTHLISEYGINYRY